MATKITEVLEDATATSEGGHLTWTGIPVPRGMKMNNSYVRIISGETVFLFPEQTTLTLHTDKVRIENSPEEPSW
jgi:hypothetical protein